MKRIDRETVQKVLDAANIVEVVSDFVSLKRRGANYIGLCPFHNERTPSFSVSPARGICKCFSCGKGGSSVGFLMEHEQLNFNEAIRYLAKKYNIEIKEHEMNEEERQRESERETMFAVNEFAAKKFEQTLLESEDGREIGYSYFRERGINDQSIARFHLGYAHERGNTLYDEAIHAGFPEKALVDTGLCIRRDDGTIYERFKGRVIYPVHTISGKVVAFGGRTLRADKKVAKYVNSPESIIYTKSKELYGLYQAKKSIVEKKKCILVEGYMDVISMSQLGIENIVASSGTSLTEQQIRLIHRFTEDVIVIYDSDPAGIKASLRGIDMLLAEGLNLKAVLLPEGEDPDSFAQSHSLTEVEEYLAAHEQDFIRFKTDILLADAANDPIRRSQVIIDIVRSISVIPNEITRAVYVQECARALDINEKVVLSQIKKFITERNEKNADKRRLDEARESLPPEIQAETPNLDQTSSPENASATTTVTTPGTVQPKGHDKKLESHERELARYMIRYGMVPLPFYDENGNSTTITVAEYISQELGYENISFSNAPYQRIMEETLRIGRTQWGADYEKACEACMAHRSKKWEEGTARIRDAAINLADIESREKQLLQKIDEEYEEEIKQYTENYLVRELTSSPDDDVRSIATSLADSKYHLSKIHSKYTRLETEADRLIELLPRAIYGLKDAILAVKIADLQVQLKSFQSANQPADGNVLMSLLNEIKDLNNLRRDYAKYLGDRVFLPK